MEGGDNEGGDALPSDGESDVVELPSGEAAEVLSVRETRHKRTRSAATGEPKKAGETGDGLRRQVGRPQKKPRDGKGGL